MRAAGAEPAECATSALFVITPAHHLSSPPFRLQIVSGSRDKTIKLWNTLGECKYTIGEPDGHTEWVSCVRFSPVTTNPIIVSAGWDKMVKVRSLECSRILHILLGSFPAHPPASAGPHLFPPRCPCPPNFILELTLISYIVGLAQVWNLTNCKLRNNLAGHQGYVNTVTVSPDGSLCASGGKVRAGRAVQA